MFLAGKIIAQKAVSNLAWGASTTWNPSDKSAYISLSNGNLAASATTSGGGVRSTTSFTTGVHCFEVTISVLGGNSSIGIGTSSASLDFPLGMDSYSESIRTYDGLVMVNSATLATTGAIYAGAVIGVVLDIPASKVRIYRDGTLLGNFTLGSTPPLFPMIYVGVNTTFIANFGATAFAYPYN